MPFRARAPFLRKNMTKLIIIISVSMPSRASTPFLLRWLQFVTIVNIGVSMPFRADAAFLRKNACRRIQKRLLCINALSGWCSISTAINVVKKIVSEVYQCPFGLVLHFYKSIRMKLLQKEFAYQCPFGLVLHFYSKIAFEIYGLAKYQCPFGLVLHFYGTPSKT